MNRNQLLLLSAQDAEGLGRRAEQVAQYIEEHGASLVDVASSLERGRAALKHRGALLVRAVTDPAQALRERAPADFATGVAKPGTPRLAWLFPGQGAQFRGMARELYEQQPVFRENFDRCASVLDARLDLSLAELIFADGVSDDEPLTQTQYTQPALFVVEVCLARTLAHFGVQPDVLIGHSLGELAAACFSGVFELEAGLVLAHERGRLMQSMPSGSMLAIKAPLDSVQPLLDGDMDLAAVNAPSMVVISGPHEVMDRLEARVAEASLDCRRLRTSHAFHSAMMDPVVEAFKSLVIEAQPRPPRVPIISSLTAEPLRDDEATSPEYWARQLRHAVNYAGAAATLLASGDCALVEVGPGTTLLSATAQQRSQPRPRASIDTLGHPKQARSASEALLLSLGRLWIAGVDVDWSRVYEGASDRLLRLPRYRFANERYWVSPPEGESDSPRLLLPGQEREDDGTLTIADHVAALVSARMGEELPEVDRVRTFVELGFDSLALTQLGGRIRERFGIRVGHRVLFESANTPARLADYLQEEGAKIQSASDSRTRALTEPTSERTEQQASYDLTPGQREIWVQSRASDAASQSYVQCRRISIRGEIDPQVMTRAFEFVSSRHPSLRARFATDGATQDDRGAEPQFVFRDLQELDDTERQRFLDDLVQSEGGRVFDLRRGPLLFGFLVRMNEEHFELCINAHHIVYDGRTSALFVSELSRAYTDLEQGKAPQLEPATDFRWYVGRLAAEDREPDLAFWKERFDTLPELLELPVDRPRTSTRSFSGATRYVRLPMQLLPKVYTLAEQQQTSAFTILLAAYQTLLARLTAQSDVVVAVPFQSPGVEEVASLAGHTVNLLPVRTLVEAEMSFEQHLRTVHDTLLSARDHSSITFSELLAELPVKREAGRMPLVETMFNVSRKLDQIPFGSSRGTLEYVDKHAIQYDLFLNVVPRGDDLLLVCDYISANYDGETIERWLHYYLRIVEQACQNPKKEIGDFALLSEAERQAILEQQPPKVEFDRKGHTAKRFLEVAKRNPEAVALTAGDEVWTYRQLARRSKQLANVLIERGVGPGSIVAVCLPRDPDLVASLLAIWLAGGAYVPVDPNFPPERIDIILEDADPTILLTTEGLGQRLRSTAQTLLLDREAEAIASASARKPKNRTTGDDLAYIIFTSGSTGRPKGVQIHHRGFTNFLDGMRAEPGFSAEDCVMGISTISFDIAGLELFLPLTTGGSVDLVPHEVVLEPRALAKRIDQVGATVLQATPASYRMLIDSGWKGNSRLRMLCGAEPLRRPMADELLARGAELWNLYGPTETTVWTTISRVHSDREIDIGQAIQNTTTYVVDARGQLQPPGVAGELWIGGEGVGFGYKDKEELTAEKFVPDPFSDAPGATAYRTGDLVRMDRSGVLHFIGRLDYQVKVRGFRIELGEIESVLVNQEGVAQAVVLARPDIHGENELVAYLVGDGALPSIAEIRARLVEILPGYMVPAHFVELDVFPLTPTGKIDRKSLPDPREVGAPSLDTSDTLAAEQTPRSPAEEILQQIWQEVLGIRKPGIHENYYELGGNSLGAVRIVDAAHSAGIEISPLQFFQTPTIAGLAEASSTRTLEGVDSSLVVLREALDENSEPPLFLVHSAPGDVVGYAQLLRSLEPGRAVYGFQSPGLKDPTLVSRSIRDMASHYVQVMKAVLPKGPYHLAGWCFGGNVALEMAQILRQNGDHLGVVALLEAFPRIDQDARSIGRRALLTARMGTEGVRLLRQSIEAKLRNRTVVEQEAEDVYDLSLESGPFKHRRAVYDANIRAMRAHRTSPFDGRVLLIKSTHSRGGIRDPDYGWRRFVSDLRVHEVSAKHEELLAPPYATDLAATLAQALAGD